MAIWCRWRGCRFFKIYWGTQEGAEWFDKRIKRSWEITKNYYSKVWETWGIVLCWGSKVWWVEVIIKRRNAF